MDIIKLAKESPRYIIIIVLAFLGKLYIEKKIDAVNARVAGISETSLGIKADLRTEERQSLVEFRVALEKWEHHLFTSLTYISTRAISTELINTHYEQQDNLQLEVKVALAKLGVVLQNEDLYVSAVSIIVDISRTHSPIFNERLPVLIDLQAEAEPLEFEAQQLIESAKAGKSQPGTIDRLKEIQIQLADIGTRRTTVMQEAADETVKVYPALVEKLVTLKEVMNAQVYRAMNSDQIDEE